MWSWHLPTKAHCSWSKMILNYQMTVGSIPKTERSGWTGRFLVVKSFLLDGKNPPSGQALLVLRKKTNKPRYFDRFFVNFFSTFCFEREKPLLVLLAQCGLRKPKKKHTPRYDSRPTSNPIIHSSTPILIQVWRRLVS